MAHNTGNGATITFTGVSGSIRSINPGAFKLAGIDDSTLATTDIQEMIKSDLHTCDEVEIEYLFDTDDSLIDITNAASTLTITWPMDTGQTTAATLAGTAFVTEASFPTLANDELQVATVKFQFDGKTGPAFTAGS
jgi:hypothetical protein